MVHRVLERWHKAGGRAGELLALAAEELAEMRLHPLVRSLWWPRLEKGLEWIDAEIAAQERSGRRVLVSEARGEMEYLGVRVHGRADRIDQLADGTLAVVDYKTGGPPSPAMAEQGFALQIGTLGLIAADGGFPGVMGEPNRFEYWSLGKSKDSDTGFGYVVEPIKEGRKKTGLLREEVLLKTEEFLADAIRRWIKGDDAFTARLNPDIGGFNDFDQLMRLDEWQARSEREP